MTILSRRSFLLPVFLLVPLCGGALLSPPLLATAYAGVEEEEAAKDKADAAVRDAKDPIEKINAYFSRADLPNQMYGPDDSDWDLAVDDLHEALKLAAEYEKDGQHTVKGKGEIYFRLAYTLGSMSRLRLDDKAVIKNYDLAEAAGYETDHAKTDDKGAALWNNRAVAKRHLGDFAGALKDLDHAIDLFKDSIWFKNRADVKFDLGDYDAAVADWNLAKASNPRLDDAPYDPEIAPLNKAVVTSPKSAVPLLARAHFYIKKAREAKTVGNAMPFFVSYTPRFRRIDAPAKPKPATHSKLEWMQFALADLDRAVEVEPTSSVAWLERGRARNLFLGVDDWKDIVPFPDDGPLSDFKAAVEADNKNAAAWVEVGRGQLRAIEADDLPVVGESEAQWTAKKQTKLDEAIASISRAIYLRPNSSGEAHYLRALAERNKTSIDLHTLIVDYTAAIEQKLSTIDDPDAAAPDPAKYVVAHNVLGQVAMQEGRLDTAVSEFSQQIQLDAKDPDPHMDRGKIYTQQGKYDLAIADFTFVITANPKLTEAWWLRAAAHDGKDEVELAKADLAEAIKIEPARTELLTGSRYAAQNPQPNVRIVPAPVKGDLPFDITGTALEHKNAGNALRGKKDLASALEEYNKAIRLDPKFADAYNNRGSLYHDRGEWDLAMADYTRTLEIDPKHRVAYMNRGLLWRSVGDHARERVDLDKALEYAEDDTRKGTVYAERATTRFNAGDKTGALADAKQGVQLSPKTVFTWKVLGRVQMNSAMYADALKSMQQAVTLEPNSRDSQVNVALAMAYLGDAGAPDQFKKALVGADAEEIQSIIYTVDIGLQNQPTSAVFRQIKADLEKTAQK